MSDTDVRHTAAPPAFYSPLARTLLEEWARLGASPSVRRSAKRWGIVPAERLTLDRHPLDPVLEAVGFLGATNDSAADSALHRLVVLAAADELAARVVLQRILPALVAIARRRGPMCGGPQAAFTELLAAAWIVIRTYPVERRPNKVAANLVRDAEYHAFVRAHRLRSSKEEVGLPEHAPQAADLTGVSLDQAPDVAEELGELLGLARVAGVPPVDLAFLDAWAHGADTRSLASRFDICERSVRNRRRQVVHQLRQLALAAEAA